MGILDTAETSVPPHGVDMEHRGEYKPPKTVRRGDIQPPKETLRDVLIKSLKTGNRDWDTLCAVAKAHPHKAVSTILTQLLREDLVSLTPEGKFVFVAPVFQAKTSAVQATKVRQNLVEQTSPSQRHDIITTSQKVESKSALALDGMKRLIMLLANRSFETEERYQRLLQDTRSELESERQARLTLQNNILAVFEDG